MKSRKALIDELNQSMQRVGTLTVLHTNAIASRIGLSATEFEAMDIISHYQPMTAGKLSLYCGLTSGAITGLIDRLERAGCVCRVSDPEDRRRVLIEPIENQEKSQKIRELYQPMARAFDELVDDCSPEQLQFLIDMHNKISDKTEKIISELREK